MNPVHKQAAIDAQKALIKAIKVAVKAMEKIERPRTVDGGRIYSLKGACKNIAKWIADTKKL